MTEWELLTAEVIRLREENKLLLAYNKRLIIEHTELEDKLDDNIKVIDRLQREKEVLMDAAVRGCKTIQIIQEPSVDTAIYNNTIMFLEQRYTELHNQMRQMKEDYEKRIRGIL